MIKATQLIMFVILLVTTTALAADDGAARRDFTAMKTFLARYCAECHGSEEPEGELSLQQLDQQQWQNERLLNDILKTLETREMPPEEAERHPSGDEVASVRRQLKNRLDVIGRSQLPGTLKRLNKTEYQNTINDLLIAEFDVAGQLPVDNTGNGFDNTGEKLFTSPFALDTYYRVASQVVEKTVGPRPVPSESRHIYESHGIKKLFHNFTLSSDGALMLAMNGHAARIMIDVKRAGVYEVQIAGYYHQGALRYGRGGDRKAKRETAVNVPPEYQRLKFEVSPVENRRQLLAQGEFNLKDKYRVYLRPGDMTAISSYSYAFPLPDLATIAPEDRSKIDFPADKSQFVQLTMFCLSSATVTGPYYDSWPPKTPFYDEYFAGVKEGDSFDKCSAIIKRLAPKVFRRPVDDAILREYYAIAERVYASGGDIFGGVQAALKAMLCSPDFLFKYEGAGRTLDDYAIASRMSYFLWNTLPDDRLFDLAAQGKLKDSAVRRAEALRMVEDPRSDRFVHDFVAQWLELHKLDDITPMPERYTEKQFARVKPYLKQETFAFFKEVLHGNLSILNFIDSDFVMLNAELNDIYQLKARVPSRTLRRTAIKDSPRGGLFTQPGILLMTTSNGEFTNPFYRGAWIARNLYGDDLEPPTDAVVSALKPPTESENIKANIRLHRENKQCNSCHRKLDPFGLALENFDVMGRWRDRYSKVVTTTNTVQVKSKNTVQTKEVVEHSLVPTNVVESATVHADGRMIDGPEGLKRLLMEDKDKIARTLIERIFVYSICRETTYRDRKFIDALFDELAANDFKLGDLIINMVSGDSFIDR